MVSALAAGDGSINLKQTYIIWLIMMTLGGPKFKLYKYNILLYK